MSRRALVLAVVGLGLVAGCGADEPPAVGPAPDATAAPVSTAGQVLRERPCRARATPFEPTRLSVPGVVRDAAVVTPARVSATVPGTPPTDATGKLQAAYDRAQGVEPGDRRGNVLLNAHTFPGGPEETALGNRLLEGLDEGDRIVLRGEGRELCYHVTERVEVPADEPFPRYYEADGRPRVAIVVCSGERLGPGVWTQRTVWFASPGA